MTWLIDVVVGVECRFGYIWILIYLFDCFRFFFLWFCSHEATLVAVEAEVVSRRLMSILL